MSPDRRSEEGVGLIAAVFLIVVLAMLGTALVRLTVTEQAAVNREMASTYAFFAAETAAQWGMYQVVAQGNSALGGAQPLSGVSVAGLAGCQNSVIPTPGIKKFGSVSPPGGPLDLFQLRVVGTCFPNSPEITRRVLELRFAND
jgi:MSHA biogenesis protein MshP